MTHDEWLELNGKTVTLNGHTHMLKVSGHQAIYPYPHESLSVSAEPKNKSSRYYRTTKEQLGDDWVTDVLSNFDTECDVLNQLKAGPFA